MLNRFPVTTGGVPAVLRYPQDPANAARWDPVGVGVGKKPRDAIAK
jgi:hypothetical protein